MHTEQVILNPKLGCVAQKGHHHTKRRTGVHGPVRPSFGMTPNF